MLFLWLFLAYAYGFLVALMWHRDATYRMSRISDNLAGIIFGWWLLPIAFIASSLIDRLRSIYGWVKYNW